MMRPPIDELDGVISEIESLAGGDNLTASPPTIAWKTVLSAAPAASGPRQGAGADAALLTLGVRSAEECDR